GTSMATLTALKDKYGYEYFDALGRQRVQIEYGTAEAIRKLESGEYRTIMILEESILQKREEGSNLEVIYPTDGTVMIPSTIMIINNKWSANRNTTAAEAITDWFLSEKGQNAIVSGWMHSVRKDFPRLPYDARPTNEIRANSMPVNWESNYRQREEIIARFEDRR
ncbi:MAG: ABC transporter substrate-binding protein, partial [Treponema sp.]|nr:ABC transporter substrate-binding protein [Treponema sp.]